MERLSDPQLAALAGNLRQLRQRRALTQEALAELAEISVRTLQFLEGARFGCSLQVLVRLRRALDSSWEELLRGLE